MSDLKIGIIGGGNLGHALAVLVGRNLGSENVVYASSWREWSGEVTALLADGSSVTRQVRAVGDPRDAVADADIVFVTLPGHVRESALADIARHVPDEARIVFVPASGFFWLQWAHATGMWAEPRRLFALERVPYICRTRSLGTSVDVSSVKPAVRLIGHPGPPRAEDYSLLQSVLEMDVDAGGHPLASVLSRSNPILHTSRLYGLFSGFDPSRPLEDVPLFYEDWDLRSSELLVAMDDEVSLIHNEILGEDVPQTGVLRHYEVADPVELTAKIRSIPAFRGILAPMSRLGDGWQPDTASRYFLEDFPVGLLGIYSLAQLVGARTPTIREVLGWGGKQVGRDWISGGGGLQLDPALDVALPQTLGISGSSVSRVRTRVLPRRGEAG